MKFRNFNQLSAVISLGCLILIMACKPKTIRESVNDDQYFETSVQELETVSTYCSADNLEDLSYSNFYGCPSNSVIGSQIRGTEEAQP